MRTWKLKSIMISWIAIVIVLVGSNTTVLGQTSSKTSAGLERARALINKDLTHINQQQDRVKLLEDKSNKEFNAGITGTNTRSEIIKAEADLSAAKSYLVADKIELLRMHQSLIDERKANIKLERAELKGAQKNLRMTRAKGNASASYYSKEVVQRKRAIAQSQTVLKQEIASRNSDLSATNKKIMEISGQSAASLAFEDNWARNQNAIVEK